MNKEITLKPCREAFEACFTQAYKHRTEHGYKGEYYETWEGWEAAYIQVLTSRWKCMYMQC